MGFGFLIRASALAAVVFLAACDSAEERADAHYKTGLEYLQAGDVDRALVEFRNVFQLNGTHHDARMAYAQAERGRGHFREAYSQYLRVIEQYPNDIPALTALSEIAVDAGDWAEADRHLTTALKLAPTDGHLNALRVFRAYGSATDTNDSATIVASVKEAQSLREKSPNEILTHEVVIDDLIRSQKFSQALGELNAAIALFPTDKKLYAQRLSVNGALRDDSAVESGLVEMVKLFPDAPEVREALLRWYLSRKEFDKAEASLRSQISPESEDIDPVIALVSFLGQYRGSDAAIAELDKQIAVGKALPVLRSARAGFVFDKGDQAAAIAEMEDILKGAEENDDTRKIRIGLARMQMAAGNAVAARALVEDVLAQDKLQPEAVKMKANWLIMEDKVNDATALLRDAIDQSSGDASLLTLLAEAYERDGNRDLMRETLGQAVQASGHAPEESLRYAQLLASEDKLVPAEGTLIDALRMSPGNPDILLALGQIYVGMKDWPRAEAVAKELEALKEPALSNQVSAIRAAILQGQSRADEALTYLQSLATGPDAGVDAQIAVLQNHLANGRVTEALNFASKLLAGDPENLDLQYVNGTVLAMAGKLPEAETFFRSVVSSDPQRPAAWLALYKTIRATPARQAEGAALLEDALAENPTSGELRWAKAGELEAAGDIDGAIALYETLYQENSANPIVANNLASLLSSYRNDPDSLARAEVIARRLRGSDVPPYEDTFGWIAYLNKDLGSAVPELEKAAVGLPGDPTVQYHLGMAYLAAGRKPDALRQFGKMDKLIPADSKAEFAVSGRAEMAKLVAEGVTE